MTKSVLISIVLFTAFTLNLAAQRNRDKRNDRSTRVVTIYEEGAKTEVSVPGIKVEVDDFNDTITKITIGSRRFEVIEDHNRSRVRMVRIPIDRFKGHWAGFELGFNGYMSSGFSTSLPADAQFMDLNQGKAVTVGINFLQYNIGLQRYKNNLGLVVGSGLTWYNYRTDKPYYFERDPETGSTIGVPVPDSKAVTKNKIMSAFLNFPLLLEWQLPATEDRHRFFISAGPYCGFRLWGHTKMAYHEGGSRHKEKSKKDININPFQYGAMVRVGYRFIKLYGTYNFSTLYTNGGGPELHPYTIGMTLISF
ncbi:outer membrane beta-barrel protein [Carboxylicivirga sp. N1Y90]|uniref:outer membrane beta-barrel protein n=1 Tax=Carboxylicivirga fragile TaxID=3417571 RepID=UPI003D32E4C3|nr:PorT family protein [Marinilabiliaceae bacterium N1Y90]